MATVLQQLFVRLVSPKLFLDCFILACSTACQPRLSVRPTRSERCLGRSEALLCATLSSLCGLQVVHNHGCSCGAGRF